MARRWFNIWFWDISKLLKNDQNLVLNLLQPPSFYARNCHLCAIEFQPRIGIHWRAGKFSPFLCQLWRETRVLPSRFGITACVLGGARFKQTQLRTSGSQSTFTIHRFLAPLNRANVSTDMQWMVNARLCESLAVNTSLTFLASPGWRLNGTQRTIKRVNSAQL